jgi:enoyl-CoA hydratase/carnithine racemase
MFRLEIDRCVARLILDRGGKRNAIPIESWAKLEKAVGEASASDVRLIVVSSADPESFCAGADLAEMPTLVDNVKLRRANKPTLAVVRGGCFGAGVSLANACDIRVAAPNAQFAITPARFGISYPQPDLEALIKLVGPGQAARLVYTSETIDAAEALRIGLVETIDEAEACGETTIARIAGNAPYSLCALKATIAGRWGVDERFDQAFASKDFSEGWDAFKTGRKPDFAR